MSQILGIHWAHTTHGTWLHGDPRGSWFEGRLIESDPFLLAEVRAKMNHRAVVLDEIEQELVADTFGSALRECRQRVYAASVRPTHVHLVFAPFAEDIKIVIARLKRRSAAAVFAERRRMGKTVPRSMWTAGRFPVFINTRKHLVNSIEYVRDHNRRIGLPADPHDWIKPLYPPARITASVSATIRQRCSSTYSPAILAGNKT